MKIITFLGVRPSLTTYSYQGKEYKGEAFAQVLSEIFPDHETMLVCVTELAKEKTFPILEALNDSRIKPVDIPTGRTTEEMWETFQIITQQVDEGDRVIFDITHGLRSLQFLVFLFATYLKAAKNVSIEAVYYGALELQGSNNGVAPVIEFSEFVSMIDWLTATTRFVKIGDGQPLASLLESAIPSNEELKNNPETRPIRDRIKQSAEAIEAISLALNLTRPIETMKSANKLEERIGNAAQSFSERAKPFSLLSDKVVQEYGQFALNQPQNTANLTENLRLQLQMIDWYIQRDKIVQAVTLAREWLVSVLVLNFELGDYMFDLKQGRDCAEKALNNATENRKPSDKRREIIPSNYDNQFEKLPQANELVKIWGTMTELRNDIAHCGMNRQPQTAETLKRKAVALYPKLEEIGTTLLP